MFAKQIVPFNGVWGASPLSSAMIKKLNLEELTDQQLIGVAKSTYHINQTFDGKSFNDSTDRQRIHNIFDIPGDTSVKQLKEWLSTVDDNCIIETERDYDGCYEQGDIPSIEINLATPKPGLKQLSDEQRQHLIADINLKISIQKQQDQERKENLRKEELKELERLEKKYLKLKNKLQK